MKQVMTLALLFYSGYVRDRFIAAGMFKEFCQPRQ